MRRNGRSGATVVRHVLISFVVPAALTAFCRQAGGQPAPAGPDPQGDQTGRSASARPEGKMPEKTPDEGSRPQGRVPGQDKPAVPPAGASRPPGSAEPRPPASMTPSAVKPKLHHRYQVGVELMFGGGFRVISPYGDIWCGERTDDPDTPNKSFCVSATPPHVEFGLSVGLARVMDLTVDFKYGLIKDKVSERRPLTLFTGVRLWIDPDVPFKIGVGLQLMMDFTRQDGEKQSRPDYGVPKKDTFDVGGRIYGQFQYDFLRYVGIFARISGTVGALRWVRVEMEGSGGVQARFP